MKHHSILIIDDEEQGAKNLEIFIESNRTDTDVIVAFEETDILKKVDNLYYDIAIVDLRMDKFSINGFDVIKRIIEVNSFAKILIMSAYLGEFEHDLNEVLSTGRIAGMFPKEDFATFSSKINLSISTIFRDMRKSSKEFSTTQLLLNYKNLKNSTILEDFKINCEKFIGFLFYSMGFSNIKTNNIESDSYNMSFLIRNEINDNFFNKFEPFFAVEYIDSIAKAKKEGYTSALNRIHDSGKLVKLIFLVTIKDVDLELFNNEFIIKEDDTLSILLSNMELEKLILSDQITKTLKQIIEDQFESRYSI